MDLIELPKYKYQKNVWALKIQAIVRNISSISEGNQESDGSATIIPEEDGYAPFHVDYDYIRKHNPKEGGYYVLDEDGNEFYCSSFVGLQKLSKLTEFQKFDIDNKPDEDKQYIVRTEVKGETGYKNKYLYHIMQYDAETNFWLSTVRLDLELPPEGTYWKELE